MDNAPEPLPEIESLNLSDVDVSALDVRLEMSSIVPNYFDCPGYCPNDFLCGCDVLI